MSTLHYKLYKRSTHLSWHVSWHMAVLVVIMGYAHTARVDVASVHDLDCMA